ncbi:MAG TPA: hypothetical protein VNI54_07300 [Thermoanaerobaculia bacterium]|nr:hypothetical protein [Thermoanaerobaculia bacterium]
MRRALPFALLLTACSTLRPIPLEWREEPGSARIRSITLDEKGGVELAPLLPLATGPVAVENNRLVRDGKRLTEQFAAIESFDYSESRDEVIFSARRDKGFDVGLAAGDGSKTNWVPADPADEVMVEWAPRGYKASYVVRAPHGDVVRTLHIPTSFQYAIDFGPATIHDLAWEKTGEKYAVAFSTIDASDRVEVLRYDGRDRVVALPPATKITADVVSFAPGAYILRPPGLRYDEKLPVVVWAVDRLEWSDSRASLMREARVAMIVARTVDDALRKAIAETPWLDGARVFGVNAKIGTSVVADRSIAAGRYRRGGDVIAVAPAAVQSFAAGFIADQLKRNPRTNGSSR